MFDRYSKALFRIFRISIVGEQTKVLTKFSCLSVPVASVEMLFNFESPAIDLLDINFSG